MMRPIPFSMEAILSFLRPLAGGVLVLTGRYSLPAGASLDLLF